MEDRSVKTKKYWSRAKPNTIEDVWRRIDCSGGADACWPWTGYCAPKGYGQVGWQGKLALVHRLIAAHSIGPVEGLVVMHTCDNPGCCNPDHLEIGTHADNCADKMEKGRWRSPRVNKRGESHPRTKLVEDDIFAIRSLREEGMTYSALGEMFGVDQSTIGGIIKGKTWGWLV